MNDIKDNLFGLPDIPEELDETGPDEFDPDEVMFAHMEAAEDGELEDYDESKCKQYAEKYGPNVLVIVHTNGVHHLLVHWCRCPGHLPDDIQALNLHFFPASFKQVRTLFTFQGINSFLAENQECKTSAWHYYQKLRRFTSGSFPHIAPVCYVYGKLLFSFQVLTCHHLKDRY
jgi:CxC2 like cysteine cluster associated with KDZ transposases